jgi:hypothetical protein
MGQEAGRKTRCSGGERGMILLEVPPWVRGHLAGWVAAKDERYPRLV